MPQDKLEFIKHSQQLLNAFVISVGAAAVRLFYKQEKTFWLYVTNFFGGLTAGMLVGYLLRDNSSLAVWKELIICSVALLGKELTAALVKIAPMIPEILVKMYINSKKKPNDVDTN